MPARTFESSLGRRVYVLPWPVCSDLMAPAGNYVKVELQCSEDRVGVEPAGWVEVWSVAAGGRSNALHNWRACWWRLWGCFYAERVHATHTRRVIHSQILATVCLSVHSNTWLSVVTGDEAAGVPCG
jgi:hypothetical protein